MAYKFSEISTKIYPEPATLLTILEKFKESKKEDRDQRKLTAVMERAWEVNTRLAGHIKKRLASVAAFGYSLNGDDTNAVDNAKINLKKAIKYIIKNWYYLDAFGKIAFNVEWILSDTKFWIPKLKMIEPSDFDGYKDEYHIWNGEDKTEAALSENFFAATTNGYLRSLIINEVLRFDALKEQGNFIKKLKGILQIIDKGTDENSRAVAMEAASTAIKNNFILTDEDLDFKLNTITAASGGSFKDVLDSFNADIAIGVLGQANTSQLPNSGGSRAALQIMKEVSADIHFLDIDMLEDFINDQLIEIYCQKNYTKPALFTFKMDIAEERGFVETAGAVSELISNGVPILKSELYKILNLTEPSEKDEIIGGLA